jgi:phosphoenolpyruvate-protein kinase (PTS system EI component)
VAEWAVLEALDQIEAVFERIEDPYFRDRRDDFAVVGLCLLYHLIGMDDSRSPEGRLRGTVAAAHELSAADVAQLCHAGAAGLCTESGGRTSQTSIIARMLGLPYVAGIVGLGDKISSGMTLVIDGSRGEVILDPDEEALRRYRSVAEGRRSGPLHVGRKPPSRPVRVVTPETNSGGVPRSVDGSPPPRDIFRTQLRVLLAGASNRPRRGD